LKFLNMSESDLEYVENYRSCVKYKQKIFWIPMGSTHILSYDIMNNSYNKIEVPIVLPNEKEKFLPYVINDNKLYMFPWRYPAIVIMDMDTNEVRVAEDWKEPYQLYQTNTELTYFRKDVLKSEGCAFLITWNAPIVFRFNLNTYEYDFMELEGCSEGLSTICKTPNAIVISDKNGELYITDFTLKRLEKLKLIGYNEKYIYNESFYLNNMVWFVSATKKIIVSLNCENMVVDYIEIESIETADRFTCVKPISEYEIFIQTDSERMYLYNTREQKLIPAFMSESYDVDNYYNMMYKKASDKMWSESCHKALGLEGYLSFLSNKFQKVSNVSINKSIGEEIVEHV